MNHNNTGENLPAFGLSLFLKLLLACTILYPAYSVMDNSVYYVRLVLPNIIFLLLFGWYLLFCPKQYRAGRDARIFSAICLVLLILYNIVCYYFNGMQNQWYWEQVNNTIDFALFLFLILCISPEEVHRMRLFPFLIVVTVISTLCCYVLFYNGLQSLNIRWLTISRNLQRENLGIRCSWLFPHKSQYALVLVMTIFAVVRHRRVFPAKWMCGGMLLLLFVALYLCDTMAAFGSLLAGMAGFFLDYLRKKGFRPNWPAMAGAVLLAAGTAAAYLYINRERSWATLGGRTGIWIGSIQSILENPTGIGRRFGRYYSVYAPNLGYVDNCHNIFFNQALRYSLPAGILFTLLIAALIGYTIYKNRSFFSVCSWIGILMILNMDYSLLPMQFPYFIVLIYFVYLYRPPASGPKPDKHLQAHTSSRILHTGK